MTMSNEELQKIIESLPECQLNKLKEYAKELLNEENKNINEGLDYVFKNYNKTLRGLKDR